MSRHLSASERWEQGDDLPAFNEEHIYTGGIAAHELYTVETRMSSKFSITTQVYQCSIRQISTTIYKYTNT